MAADPLPEVVTVTVFMEDLRTGVARTEYFGPALLRLKTQLMWHGTPSSTLSLQDWAIALITLIHRMVPHQWISAMLRMMKLSFRLLSSTWGYVDVSSVVVPPIYRLGALLVSHAQLLHANAPREEPLSCRGESAILSRRGAPCWGRTEFC